MSELLMRQGNGRRKNRWATFALTPPVLPETCFGPLTTPTALGRAGCTHEETRCLLETRESENTPLEEEALSTESGEKMYKGTLGKVQLFFVRAKRPHNRYEVMLLTW